MSPVPPPLPWPVRVRAEKTLLLCVSALAVFAGAWCLISAAGLAGWPCVWKSCTAWPCAGCGSTRAVILLSSGSWADALALNPAAVLLVPLLAAAALYAAIVLLFRLDPWRPVWARRIPWRWLAVAALLVNWVYLLAAGRT